MQQKKRGIVLKKTPYGDDDLIVHFLTEEGLHLSLFAAGARKSARRFGTTLDLFNELEIQYREKNSNLLRIDSAELLTLMEGIRKALPKYAAACYFTEMILSFLQEREASFVLYKSFREFLATLNDPAPMDSHLIPLMEHHFLDLFGFKPTLNRCLDCGKGVSPQSTYFFEGIKGGIVCTPCKAGPKGGSSAEFPLTYNAIRQILLASPSPEGWKKSALKPLEISQTRKAFEYFIQYTAGRPLKSLQFLSNILA